MTKDSLRNFTVRFLGSALRRVESIAKPFYGGRLSTGEAIRRLAEERLDEIERSSPRESTRDALLRVRSAWRSGQILPLDDLRLLAELANRTYQLCRQDYVSRALLVANVSAFRDAVRLATRGKTKAIEPEERYFVRNLGSSEEIEAKSLPEYVDKWIALLEERPSRTQAEFASRNLSAYLDDETFPDEQQAAKTLNAYVPELLQVAIHAYWDREGIPLIPPPTSVHDRASPTRVGTAIVSGDVVLRPVVSDTSFAASIELTTRDSAVVANNVVRLEDLAEVTRIAAAGSDARGSTFAWSIEGDKTKRFVLSAEGVWWRFSETDFASFAQCLDTLYQEPSMAALIKHLRYFYGRV
jgi:hypothetical protein